MEISQIDKIAWRIDFKDYTEMVDFARLILNLSGDD